MGLLQHGTRHSAQSHFTLHTFRRSCRGPLTTARGPAMTDTGGLVHLARHARRQDVRPVSTVGRVARNRMLRVWYATRASFQNTATSSAALTFTLVLGMQCGLQHYGPCRVQVIR